MGKNLRINIRVFNQLENDNTENKSIFSRDGYIEDQNGMGAVLFGDVTAKYAGCGAIAAWNILKFFNKEMDKATLFDEMEAGLICNGQLGMNNFFLKKYLTQKGFKVGMHLSLKKFKKTAPQQGIVYYMKNNFRAHYVAFTPMGSNEKGEILYRFHNASVGSYWKKTGPKRYIENLPLTMEEFLIASGAKVKVFYDVRA